MAGSRAASAREPGQIREEAALSDTARAPRTSLAGADDRRARPSAGLEDGCTVHTLGRSMADEDSLEVARLLVERWNKGDVDGVLDLFADDASMYPGAEWPEQVTYHGRDGISENIEQWRTVWESSQVEARRIEAYGDQVVASGDWNTRGRGSGVEGRMPFVILLEVRKERIARFEWFTDHNEAVAAARQA